ncbi:MAG: polyphosphate kinase 1 [Halobacteriovoraceae bacterium]|nr:polyphosphate kinase 1 [Halobacteriovoraceae bacterium]
MKKNKTLKGKKKKQLFSPTGKFNPDEFFNRELSWLEFNSRVLNEAVDERTPLLERFRFLSIYASNLDEFVMKRVGGLKGQLESDFSYKSIDGLSPQEQLLKIREKLLVDNKLQEKTFELLKDELRKNKIELIKWEQLSSSERDFCNEHFLTKIFPILTPLSVDSGKPFPFISNLSYSFGLYLKNPLTQEVSFSRVKLPENVHKWLELPLEKDQERRLINTSQIIKANLSTLYHGLEIVDVMPFRVTRNADWEHADEDTEDLLELVEEAVNFRRLQEPIRLECLNNCNKEMLKYLKDELQLKDTDIYFYESALDYLSSNSIADLDIPELSYPGWRPLTHMPFQKGNIFERIRERDLFVHHPYENFVTSAERFIVEASEDPNVLSIKMTLYRTGDNSQFIRSLIEAAENGKQVVCLIELKARFDEKRNIHWARKMEDAGVHVVYGIVGLKTHTKIAMVVRKESKGQLLRYVHIGTGNYNSKTAKLYTDMGIFTIDKGITSEVNEVFNYLTGTSLKVDYQTLLVSPINAKSSFIRLIEKQAKLASQGEKVRIVAKMNSLEDAVITEALYAASQAGVQIDLIVRGFCCLKPGVKGLSENIRVISIIGRFLEHSRVFFFSSPGSEWEGDYYIGSADWMHRNMHARVEVMAPILLSSIKEKISVFLKVLLSDKRSAWELDSSGNYLQRKGGEKSGTHLVMMKKTLEELEKSDLGT